jgi:hypothetical protein
MTTLPSWAAGGPEITVPVVPAEPAVVPANPAGVASVASLVTGQDAFRANLAAFLRSERGKHTKLANMAATGPQGQAMFGGNGAIGGPHVQTQGTRAGSIVQVVRLGGREYHIYFHKNGQREVIAMPKAGAQPAAAAAVPAAATGGMLAPS